MKCELCGSTSSKYKWSNIPLCEDKILCDDCAKAQLKAFFEDNGPEYSAESASHYVEYKQALELLESFD